MELLGPLCITVPVRDPVKLAEAICDTLGDKDRWMIGDALRKRASEKFSLEKMLEETDKLYRELSNNSDR